MIKFTIASKPSFVVEDILFDDGVTQLPGYRVNLPSEGDVRLSEGDWIETDTDGEPVKIIRLSDYQGSAILENLVREQIGKDLVRDLYATLRAQKLTQTQEGDLLSRIYPVLGCLADGFIRGARVICNATATGGEFTTARKNYVLNQIDNAIAKL